MTNFEKLTEICLKQGRGIYTSSTRRNSSIVITHPETLDIQYEMGGNDSIDYFSGMLLPKLEKANILKVVK